MGAALEADVGTMRLHRQVEKFIEQSGIPFTFLRPNEFMQNFVNFYSPSIKGNNAFYVPLEDAKVSLVDVRDIAAVAVKSLRDEEKHKNKTYLITGPEAVSYHQLAEILSNTTGRKINYVNISEKEKHQKYLRPLKKLQERNQYRFPSSPMIMQKLSDESQMNI